MKKLLITLLSLMVALTLCACAAGEKNDGLVLNQAELTKEEQDILSLLGSSQASIFDYTVDERIRTIYIERYALTQEGTWEAFGGAGFAANGSGRIALSMEPSRNEIRFAIQDEHGTSAVKHSYPDSDFTGMSIATSLAPASTKIKPNQEIPLAVQIITSQDETYSYDADYFFHPEEYAKHGYEYVYAVTVRFSDEGLN